MALAGAVLGGRYVLEKQIGSGGYGEVWRAADTVLSRPVAVKLLHPRYTRRSEALARFRAEARHAGGLSHENIAQVFDYVEPAGGQPPYLVMELVDGPSLETVLAGGPLDDSRTMDIVAQTAAGLQAAHAAGMIHRDIKPAQPAARAGRYRQDHRLRHRAHDRLGTGHGQRGTGRHARLPGTRTGDGRTGHPGQRPVFPRAWWPTSACPALRRSGARPWRWRWLTGIARCRRCPRRSEPTCARS